MKSNLPAGSYPAYKVSTELRWVDTEGCAHLFALPVSYRDVLCERLAANFPLHEANLASRLACLIVAMDPKRDGKPFPLCRRGLSGQDYEDGKPRHLTDAVKALGFTEWQARIAIRALRVVQFVQGWSQQVLDAAKSTWASWRRVLPFTPARGKDWNKGMLRRAANLYVIGDEFVRAAMAERRRRSASSARKAFLADRARRRVEIDQQRAATYEGTETDAQILGSVLPPLPDTRLDEDSRKLEQKKRPDLLEEGSSTLGEKPMFAGFDVLKMAMAAAMRTKPGDDLSDFLPGTDSTDHDS